LVQQELHEQTESVASSNSTPLHLCVIQLIETPNFFPCVIDSGPKHLEGVGVYLHQPPFLSGFSLVPVLLVA